VTDAPPGAAPLSVQAIAEEIARITAENARLQARLGEVEKRFRAVSRGVLRAQEAERGRLSRELHDGVGQSLTALKMELDMLAQSAAHETSALASRLRELGGLADQSLQEVRQISHQLRPQMLDDLGLAPTLRWFTRAFERRTGIAVELAQSGCEEERLHPDLESLVYRIVQEALTNTAKHAQAPSARIDLRRAGGRLRLTVEDRGRGFDVAAALDGAAEDRGFGLRGMRDRVQLFGGTLSVRSSAEAGTAVEVDVPLEGGS
jgi:two-component system, NarL family, sensor kinase